MVVDVLFFLSFYDRKSSFSLFDILKNRQNQWLSLTDSNSIIVYRHFFRTFAGENLLEIQAFVSKLRWVLIVPLWN